MFLKLNTNQAYITGLLSDYLIPKIYCFDLLLVLNFFIFLFSKKNYLISKKNKIKLKKIDYLILFLSVIFLINQLLNFNLNLFFFILRFGLILIFIFASATNQKNQKYLYQGLLISIVWQSALAYYQFIYQKSVAPYYLFGETNLQHFANISRAQFLNIEKILPYGSTAHPNILAGIISIFSILAIDKLQEKKWLKILLLSNALIICLMTQSLAAFLTVSSYLIYLVIKKINKNKNKISIKWQKIFNLILMLFFVLSPVLIKQITLASADHQLSISRRVMLNDAAWQMFLAKPIFGVGYQNFLRELETYSQSQEAVRFVQPVHHLGLLLISEGGLLIGLVLVLLAYKFNKRLNWSKLLMLSPIASLDHYLITQPVGLFALCLFIVLTRNRNLRRT